jgi:PKD repeat protein
MKKIYTFFLALLSIAAPCQNTTDAAVQLRAVVQTSPAQITISWLPAPNSSQYQVFRKLKNGTSWGAVVAILNNTATQYVDNTVTAGVSYEYKVAVAGTNYSGYGYINAGIEIQETHFRGTMLLLVDSTFIGSLSSELSRLEDDLEGDGWRVIRRDLDRNGNPGHIRGVIQSYYAADPTNTKAVFIFGHLPVPYSGFLNPDGHPDHYGAWPADVYYGDVNGTWTDASGPATSTASPPRTENNPGDGKFDQTTISDVELQVGRVDLYDLPAFTFNEEQLLRNYLDKDHAYRKKLYVPQRRAVIDDNFGYFSAEAFAASGYKNFAPLLGTDSIVAADYITSLGSGSYLWAYGCGGGSYNSAGGIGTTASIAGSTLQGTFSMLFGSYFGDWDVTNSFLRAPLASGSVLTDVWSGRPHYQFHHMALGENIGYSFLTTQNYSGSLYFGSAYPITGKWVHNALMGDPSLRNDIIAPVPFVNATNSGFHALVQWKASPDTGVIGYNIYRRLTSAPFYTKLNPSRIADTSYVDSCIWEPGVYKYMVRAVKLEETPSGSYYNMSEGTTYTLLSSSIPTVVASFSVIQSANTVTLINTSLGTGLSTWHLSDGSQSSVASPTVEYTENGTYTVMLVLKGECDNDTLVQSITVMGLGLNKQTLHNYLKVFPNPTRGQLTLKSEATGTVKVYDLLGQSVFEGVKTQTEFTFDLAQFSSGLYIVELQNSGQLIRVKINKN